MPRGRCANSEGERRLRDERRRHVNLDDPYAVLEFAYDAAERGDEAALMSLFEEATEGRLTAQAIVNVLSATNWPGQVQLNAMLGWKDVNMTERLVSRRAEFVALASTWLDKHEPERKLGLLRGLVPKGNGDD
jgi:hypothetical protein